MSRVCDTPWDLDITEPLTAVRETLDEASWNEADACDRERLWRSQLPGAASKDDSTSRTRI